MIGFPIDSHVTFDAENLPVYDRAITSAPYRRLNSSLYTNGVSTRPLTSLKVEADNGMTIHVNPGFAMVNGCMKLEEEMIAIEIDPPDASYARIDRVVVRLDDSDEVRSCEVRLRKGTPAAEPVAPELVRSGAIYEIGLAEVYVNVGATAISDLDILDTRYDENLCGKMDVLATIPVDTELDPTSINPVENQAITSVINQMSSNINVKVDDFDEELQILWLVGV